MRHARVLIAALMVALALLVGCAPEGAMDVTPTEDVSPEAPGPAPEGTPTEEPTDTPAPTTPPPDEPEVPDDAEAAVAWARGDLASRLSAVEEEIALVAIEAVEWRDSSLGCPQPGQMYLQVITPGYRFVLRADDTTYEYHSARGADQAVLCQEAG